jgi:hypothetical protein
LNFQQFLDDKKFLKVGKSNNFLDVFSGFFLVFQKNEGDNNSFVRPRCLFGYGE